ncbi:MAG: ABC transporter ATP-binding protein [Candidatus Eisenbacteria bacterium]
MSGTAWIEFEGVNLDRGGRPVLRDLSASLGGYAVGLVGANGAGKSTLIGALLGVLRARSGRIRVLGMDLPGAAQQVRTRAGVMAEQAGVFPGGSGVEAVMFAGQLTGLRRKEALRRAHRALDALDVGEERYRPTLGYSTGMRQRCKLAMSLVHDPEILILDEPTVGLDPPGRLQLLELIRDLKTEGRRILISTHILQDAEFLCDELLLLQAGTVAYSGTISALVGTRDEMLIARGPQLGAQLAGVLGAAGVDVLGSGVDELRFRSSSDALRTFWKLVADRSLEVRRLERHALDFEDAVVEAMTGTRATNGAPPRLGERGNEGVAR